MPIKTFNVRVGESIPLRISFLNRLKDFQASGQTLTSGSISWVSQTPGRASFDIGSGALVSSDQGLQLNIPNDAVIGRFTMLTAGLVTVKLSVAAINPTATYVGVAQFFIEDIPTP